MKTDGRVICALDSMTKSLDQLNATVTTVQTQLLSQRKIHELQKLSRLLANMVIDVQQFEINLIDGPSQNQVWNDYFAEIEKLSGSLLAHGVFNDKPVTWVRSEESPAAQRAKELGIETRVAQEDPLLSDES